MITITAAYVAGDRDNLRGAFRTAICNLFADAVRRLGYEPAYSVGPRTPDDTALVSFSVTVADPDAALALFWACGSRGVATYTQLTVATDRPDQAARLKLLGYFPTLED